MDSGLLAICVLGAPLELFRKGEILWTGGSSCAPALILHFFLTGSRGLRVLQVWAASAADKLVFFLVPCPQLFGEGGERDCVTALLLVVTVMLAVRQTGVSCPSLAAP